MKPQSSAQLPRLHRLLLTRFPSTRLWLYHTPKYNSAAFSAQDFSKIQHSSENRGSQDAAIDSFTTMAHNMKRKKMILHVINIMDYHCTTGEEFREMHRLKPSHKRDLYHLKLRFLRSFQFNAYKLVYTN